MGTEPAGAHRGGREGPARPAWAWLFFFVRPPDDLPREHWSLLGLLGVTVLVNHYDFAILGLALPQIQAGLGVSEERIGGLVSVVRAGAVPALLLALGADLAGRRRLLLVTLAGFTVCTALTAFARTAEEFAALQFAARTLVTAEELLAIVVVAEELRPQHRGYGIGVLAAFGALGHGVAAALFGFVEVLPFGWRALYLLGAFPLALLAWLRRRLPETRRFEAELATTAGAARSRLAPLRDLWSLYPRRMLALCAAILPASVVALTAVAFASKTLQEVHGFEPYHVTWLVLSAGILVFTGTLLAGRLADRFGRRRVLCVAVVANAAGAAFFYNGGAIPVVVAAWVVAMFAFVATDVLFGALGGELFPTSYRSTASGVRALAWTLGGVLGLAAEGLLYTATGSHAAAITALLSLAWIPPLVIAFLLPETARRELEDIAPGRSARP